MGFRAKAEPVEGKIKPEDHAAGGAGEPGQVASSEAGLLLSEILDRAFEAIISITPEHHIKVFNKGAERIFGYSVEEIVGQPLEILIPSRFRMSHSDHIENFAGSNESGRLMDRRGEIKGLRKDGSEFWAEASISKLQIDGAVVFTVVMRDITERLESEAALLKSQTSYYDLIEGFQYGISIHQDSKLVFVNQEAANMHGYFQKEAASNEIGDFIAPDAMPQVTRAVDDLLDGRVTQEHFEYTAIRKDGTTFQIEVRAQLIDWNGRPAVLNALVDVSGRKRAEDSEARLGRIIERSLNEVFTFDAESLLFLEVNLGARSNLGYTLEELRRMTPVDIKPEFDPEMFEEAIMPLREGTLDKLVFETIHERKDGSAYNVEVHLQLMTEEKPFVFVATIKDITDRKQAEKELNFTLVQSDQANQSKSEFLANVSHELRTPLNAVIGFSEIMNDETFGPLGSTQYQEYVREIFESGTHLLNLVNDILDLSKIEAGKMDISEEAVDIEHEFLACQRTLEGRLKKACVTMINGMAGNLPGLTADKRAIKQIFFNLLSNAIKFTPAGGEVSVAAEIDTDGQFIVTITDTGIGIAAANIQKALTSFSQVDSSLSRTQGGTGLGLPLVRSLVDLHGGSFELESELGVGTCATIRFPSGRVLDGAAQASAD